MKVRRHLGGRAGSPTGDGVTQTRGAVGTDDVPKVRAPFRLSKFMRLGDQGLSSASSILVVLVIARVYPAADFGHFAIAYSVLAMSLALCRAYLGTQISMTVSAGDARALGANFMGAMLILGLPLAGSVFLASLVLTGGGTGILVTVSLAAPMTCLQDLVRFVSIASNQPVAALVSDFTWFTMMTVVFFLPLQPGPTLLILWIGTVILSFTVGLAVARLRPVFKGSLRRLMRWDSISASMAWGAGLAQGSQVIVTTAAAVIVGPQAAAALRGASTLIGPLNVIFAYVNIAVTPVVLRRPRNSHFSSARRVTVTITLTALGWGLVLAFLPNGLGEAALGASWSITKSIILLTASQYVFLAIASGPTLILKIRRKAKILAWQKLIVAAAGVTLSILGCVLLESVAGAALGLAISGFVSAVLSWSSLLRILRDPNAQT